MTKKVSVTRFMRLRENSASASPALFASGDTSVLQPAPIELGAKGIGDTGRRIGIYDLAGIIGGLVSRVL